MADKVRKEKDKWIFVSFEQGASGHKLARVLATMPCMYWYSCKENGINPWNVGVVDDHIRQRKSSRFHFDRITPKGKLPPTHDYVEKYIPNEKQYYKMFDKLFVENGGQDIFDDDKRVIYCTHSMPGKLLEHFPNALIINIIHEPKKTTKRWMEVVKTFPAYVRHKGIVPEDNKYLKYLEILKGRKQDLTVADVWAFERKKKFWQEKYEPILTKEIYAKMFSNSVFRKTVNHERVFNTTLDIDYKEIKRWLNERLQ